MACYTRDADCSLRIFTVIMMPLQPRILHCCSIRWNSFSCLHSLQHPQKRRSCLTMFIDFRPPPKIDVARASKLISPSHVPSTQQALPSRMTFRSWCKPSQGGRKHRTSISCTASAPEKRRRCSRRAEEHRRCPVFPAPVSSRRRDPWLKGLSRCLIQVSSMFCRDFLKPV